MIPNVKDRSIASHGVERTAEFGISIADSAHIMTILRDTLYSNKVLAVLREYSANAWDAHREIGKGNLPIEVTLPTLVDPKLTIRDFGPGLSPDDVFNVYTQYGASTKRSNDTTVGMLGIGSKSAFAYADSFTITSFHGGMKRIYIAVLDQTDKGVINLLHEEPSTETGVEIQIAIQPRDIEEFINTAQKLYMYFQPRPKINTEIPELPSVQNSLKSGVIYDQRTFRNGEWVAVMGCVAYTVDLSQITGFGAESGVPDFLQNLTGALYFNIGDVQVNASREGLKYSDSTKRALLNKFNELVDEYVSATLRDIQQMEGTPWSRRVRAQTLAKLRLPIPLDAKDLVDTSIAIGEKVQDGFIIELDEAQAPHLKIDKNTRLLLRDDKRPYKGYRLDEWQYVVRKLDDKLNWDDVEASLTKMLKDLGLIGLPIVKMSTLPWAKPYNPKARYADARHRKKVFKLGDYGFSSHVKKSDNWKIIEHTPSSDDVFMILQSFEPDDNGQNLYKSDEVLMKYLGRKMPEIIGYKSTEKKPVDPAKLKGTSYRDWSEKNLQQILADPKTQKQLQTLNWSFLARRHSYYYSNWPRKDKEVLDTLRIRLGPRHPITKLVIRRNAALTWERKIGNQNNNLLQFLSKIRIRVNSSDQKIPNEADQELQDIYARYPLIQAIGEGLNCFWGEHQADWLHYIHMLDRALSIKVPDHGQLSAVHAHP